MKTQSKISKEYNPSCIITGRKDNLLMYAMRNSKNEMTGWIFVHEDIDPTQIKHQFEFNIQTK